MNKLAHLLMALTLLSCVRDLGSRPTDLTSPPETGPDRSAPCNPCVEVVPLQIQTREGGTKATFTVRLGQIPGGSVQIPLVVTPPSEARLLGPATLTFDDSNWDTPRTVEIEGVDDSRLDGQQPFTVALQIAQGSSAIYKGVDPPDVTGVNLSDEGIWRLSQTQSGKGGNGASSYPTLTADGLVAAFQTDATNLSAYARRHLLLMDMVTRSLRLPPLTTTDGQPPTDSLHWPILNSSGTHLGFYTAAQNLMPAAKNSAKDYYVLTLTGGLLRHVTATINQEADGSSAQEVPNAVTPDGRFVVFESVATNLVPGDTNGARDNFRHDLVSGVTTRVNVSSNGEQAAAGSSSTRPSISADGGLVAFVSSADNLVSGDTNGAPDIFLRDVNKRTTSRVSLGPAGQQADGPSDEPFLSADGSRVIFGSRADNLVGPRTNHVSNIFLKDLTSGAVTLVSQGQQGPADEYCGQPQLSGNNQFAVFYSKGKLVASVDSSAYQIYLVDLITAKIQLISRGESGAPGNGDSREPRVTHDARLVAFESSASNLVPGDTNSAVDIFVRER